MVRMQGSSLENPKVGWTNFQKCYYSLFLTSIDIKSISDRIFKCVSFRSAERNIKKNNGLLFLKTLVQN